MNSFDEKCGCSGRDCHHIKGICCDVKNCVFHDGETDCIAGHIAVGPSYASSCTDTVCATFKQRES